MSDLTASRKSLFRVTSNKTPPVKAAIDELRNNLSDIAHWIGDAQRDESTLLAEWEGQCLRTGRKWDLNYKRPVAPWDGSSDTVVRVADAASDELVMIMVCAFMTATPSAIQQNANDAGKAGKVGTLLKYELRQRMRDELWREINFFANWGVDYGQSVMQIGWKREYVTGKGEISAEELAAWAVSTMPPPPPGTDPAQAEQQQNAIIEDTTQQIQMALDDPTRLDQVVALMQKKYPLLTPKRAKRVAKDLAAEGGTVEFRMPVEKPGRPFAKAFCPGIDFFRPWRNYIVGRSPWKAVVEQYSEPEVYAKINTDGWKESFCEALIEQVPKKAVDQAAMDPLGVPYTVPRSSFDSPDSTSGNRRNQEMRSYYEVIHMWVECVDEDNFPAVFEIIFHPALGDKDREPQYAINRLVDDFAEGGQFVEFRREFKSRPPWDSRGVPLLTTQPQLERKWMRDGRINRNDMATNPPIRTTRRNSAGKPERLGMRPGATMMEERGQESGFVAPPQFDEGSVEEEQMIMQDVANLLGLFNKDILPAKTAMHQQYIVWNFLTACRAIAVKIIEFDQQYMDPITVSRVIGGGDVPFQVTRDEIAGQFDVQFEYDVRMSDIEYVKAIWTVMMEGINADRAGAVDTTVAIRWLYSSVNPVLADMVIKEPQAVAEEEADDERKALGLAMQGISVTPKQGANAQARLDAIHQEYATNPQFHHAYDTDKRCQDIVLARNKTWMLALQQKQNASIGATGYQPPGFMNAGPKANLSPEQPAEMP